MSPDLSKIKISVIICAFNRAENLKALLECFLTQEETDSFPHEVIVIDNNSRDNTKEIVEACIPRFAGRLSYLWEPRQGKSFALNYGIQESRGEILAFIDDDCLVEKDYLTQVRKIFRENPDIDFMGGKILPLWEEDCPAWLTDVLLDQAEYELNDERYWRRIFFRGPLAILDYGEKPFAVNQTQKMHESFLFYGPNMAIKRNVFPQVGGYALDRVITQDTEMCLRLIKQGRKGLYAPNVKVYHRIERTKLIPEFYAQWYFRRGKFLETNLLPVPRKFYHPLGIQNEFIFQTCLLFLKSMTARSLSDKVHYRGRSLFNLGQMAQIAKRNIV